MQPINWLNWEFLHNEGYGRFGRYMVKALSYLGVDVQPGIINHVFDLPGWMQRLQGWDFGALTIQMMPVWGMRALPGRVWGYTMWEDSEVPERWPGIINDTCERLLVPCTHNAEIFKAGGVRVPIHVVQGGTCSKDFPLLPIPKRKTYTFVCLGDRGQRKGVSTSWMAFFQAFPEAQYPDVRLVVKARRTNLYGLNTANFPDRRVAVWKDDVDDMQDVFAVADCIVYPAYGDGWGMWPREAAMSGLPVIATNYSGLAEGIEHWAYPLNDFEMRRSTLRANDGSRSGNGMWAVPSVEAVAEKMRWCYEHQDEARAFGLRAAEWLRENQTWEHSARALKQLLEIHG